MERVAVYIDGSNLFFKLKNPPLSIPALTKFDYAGLAKWLCRDREIISLRYYIGVIRAEDDNAKGQILRREQQKLFAHLMSPQQDFVIKRGYLMKSRNDGVYHEKGVDVKLAIDLLIGAVDNLYDTAILISSDTDLIPAIKKVRNLGKAIEYIGFAHQPSLALQRNVSLSRLLIADEIKPYISSTLSSDAL